MTAKKISLVFAALVMAFSSVLVFPIADVSGQGAGAFFELDDEDTNLILGGNEWAPLGTGFGECEVQVGAFSGGEGLQPIWDFFISRNVSEENTAGIMGNLSAESEFDPTAVNPDSGAFGLAQWLGSRITRLEAYAVARSQDKSSLELQLDFIWFELTGEHPNEQVQLAVEAAGVTGGAEIRAFEDLQTRTTVDMSAASFAMKYERYGNADVYRRAGGEIPPPPERETAFNDAFNTPFGERTSTGARGEGDRIDRARGIYEEFTGSFAATLNCSAGGGFEVGEIIVGDTSNFPCEAGEDMGIADGYANNELFKIRLCRVQNGVVINSQISGEVNAMINAAAASGLTLGGGGFRSMDGQIAARRKNCQGQVYGAPCKPPTARPGYSNHQMGFAIDITCNGTGMRPICFNWLSANAANYGLKNLPSESWHWSIDGK